MTCLHECTNEAKLGGERLALTAQLTWMAFLHGGWRLRLWRPQSLNAAVTGGVRCNQDVDDRG